MSKVYKSGLIALGCLVVGTLFALAYPLGFHLHYDPYVTISAQERPQPPTPVPVDPPPTSTNTVPRIPRVSLEIPEIRNGVSTEGQVLTIRYTCGGTISNIKCTITGPSCVIAETPAQEGCKDSETINYYWSDGKALNTVVRTRKLIVK